MKAEELLKKHHPGAAGEWHGSIFRVTLPDDGKPGNTRVVAQQRRASWAWAEAVRNLNLKGEVNR